MFFKMIIMNKKEVYIQNICSYNILMYQEGWTNMELKEIYSTDFLKSLALTINKYYKFNTEKFMTDCLQDDWQDLKLMERSNRVIESLHIQFPTDFTQAAKILKQIGPDFTGLVAICLPNYVAKYGLENWQTSMELLMLLTQYSSAEFAIRPFLIKYPKETSQQMLKWSKSENVDVRRLSSEGIRPRLPWGIRLKQYMNDPTVIMIILNNLISDDKEYVQKSVANNLNDINKDNPEIVIEFAKEYWNQSDSINWVINRGLRTLFKQGNPEVLTLLGYDKNVDQQLKNIQLSSSEKTVVIGGAVNMQYRLQTTLKKETPLYVGYRVHYIRQNKTDSYKDFFIKRTNLKGNQPLKGNFNIKWKQLTTRKLYPGKHQIDLLVNSKVVSTVEIELLEEES